MKSVKKFTCKICNKNYKSIQSLCNHNRRFHKNKPQNNTFPPQNNTKKFKNKLKCTYCNKFFSRIDSKNRHMKICKYKLKSDKEQKYKDEIKRLKERLRDKMNKN